MSPSETDLLHQLAERPDDRALRLVFSDWLQEHGDAERGEIIALCSRGEPLSLTEQRRVTRVTRQRAEAWLGPLSQVADLHRTRFDAGFVRDLVCASRPGGSFAGLVGDPRLATLRSLVLPPSHQPGEIESFMSHPYLARLERIELGGVDWRSLKTFPVAHLRPSHVAVASWGTFERELAPLRDVPLFTRAQSVGLSTTDFTNAPTVMRIVDALGRQLDAVAGFREVQLHSHYGPVEGSAEWLVSGDRLATQLRGLEVWSLEASEVGFARSRVEDGRLSELTIDLSLPEAIVSEKQAVDRGRPPMVMRLHTAAMVMSLLRPARIRSVKVKLPAGGRLRSQERHTLFAEARRWGSLEHFEIVGEAAILP